MVFVTNFIKILVLDVLVVSGRLDGAYRILEHHLKISFFKFQNFSLEKIKIEITSR